MKIEGVVFSGVGERRFCTEQRGYKKQFFENLGIDSSPATLNIKGNETETAGFLSNRKPVVVHA